MAFFKRIGLFLLTNLLIMVTVGIVWSIVASFLGPKLNGYIPMLMALSLVMGFTGAFISLFISKWMAKTMYGVQIIDENTGSPELRALVAKVHNLARMANLPKMPEVGIYESDDLNAFATGPSKKNSLVAVSTGLLRRMNEDEVEGVLGHEIAHIANGDMVTMTLIQGVVNSFVFFFSRIVANIISSNVDEKYRGVVHFIAVIVCDIAFTILGSTVVAYFSRAREFRADAGGARFAGKEKMVNALRRLQSVYESPAHLHDDDGRDALATLKISGYPKGGLAALLMTHPPLEKRIEALRQS